MKNIFIFPILLIIIFPVSGKYFFNTLSKETKQTSSAESFAGSDFIIYPTPFLQVETSAYTHPLNPDVKVASAITNFYEGGYTTGFFISTDNGSSWNGTGNIKNSSGNTITTVGDPIVLISNNGNFIMTYIAPSATSGADLKVGASYSTNNGNYWSPTIYIPGVDTADKPISETDNVAGSPFLGRSYIAYDELKNGGEEIKGVYFTYSSNGGISWDSAKRVTDINPSFKYRLISDLSVGSNGEVYVLWYTNRNYLGLAKSTNGGVNWVINKDTAVKTDSTVITYEYNNIYLTGVPSMGTDISGGARNGWVYTVSVERNTDELDLMLHRSTDGGLIWNYKRRINQDSSAVFKIQSMPAMNVDEYGGINVMYYDARNSNANDSFEVYLSRSTDGGETFRDTKISDHKFRLNQPFETLYGFEGYIGSYTGLTSGNDRLTPVWFDNSTGQYQSYSVNIELLPKLELKVFPEGFYDPAVLNLRMKDTVKVYMRGSVSPYMIIDSAKGIIDSVTFKSEIKFNYNLSPGNYYLDIRHRNSIETWSADPVFYSFGTSMNYDFTLSPASAFGSNEKSAGSKWGIYSGDVDQNGFIDLSDVISVYNESNNFAAGYIRQDCNGDSIVDLSDIIVAYNNSLLFVTKIVP